MDLFSYGKNNGSPREYSPRKSPGASILEVIDKLGRINGSQSPEEKPNEVWSEGTQEGIRSGDLPTPFDEVLQTAQYETSKSG